MKRYTLEDFKKFERHQLGYLICPCGDYTEIKEFPACCAFGSGYRSGEHCCFGKDCNFGYGCTFGKSCRFEEGCHFEYGCYFREGCRFGEVCHFGRGCIFEFFCSFGRDCVLESSCILRAGCSFEKYCDFGKACSFSTGCTVEGGKDLKSYTKIEGTGSERRCTYFYQLTDASIYVRCGCFAGYEDEFLSVVK